MASYSDAIAQTGTFQPQTRDELVLAIDLWDSDREDALANYGEINEWDVSECWSF